MADYVSVNCQTMIPDYGPLILLISMNLSNYSQIEMMCVIGAIKFN